jgi:transcriptional regulator with XRE-family HTH domain
MDDQVIGQRDGDPSGGLMQGWLGRQEVAAALGISVDTLARWETRRDGPPCIRVGRKVLYRAEAFRDWLVSRERSTSKKRGGEK